MPRKTAKSAEKPHLKLFKAPTRDVGQVYQLKITLNGTKPPIWRRIQTLDCTLAGLHEIIQTAMGWGDCHLHLFRLGDEQFGLPDQWLDEGPGDSHKVKLSSLAADGLKKFKYEYDMGDGWEHIVAIEKVVDAGDDLHYPRCLAGERACPPEDCGGVWGYASLLEALADPEHENHDDMMEWCGPIDPETFDLDAINKAWKPRKGPR